jgi:hypothetical protein
LGIKSCKSYSPEFNFVIEGLIVKIKLKSNFYILEHKIKGDLFIPKLWRKVTTWVEEIQLVAMKIIKGKLS